MLKTKAQSSKTLLPESEKNTRTHGPGRSACQGGQDPTALLRALFKISCLKILTANCQLSSYSEFIKACANVVPLMTLLKPSSKHSRKIHYQLGQNGRRQLNQNNQIFRQSITFGISSSVVLQLCRNHLAEAEICSDFSLS